ncbi:jg1533, partial [Pararge aegeria aegeria]
MGEQGSAWVLCPSKKFPGKFYYFNTQNGEKAWSWTDPTNKLHIESMEDGSPKMVNNFNDNSKAGHKQMPNDPVSSQKSVSAAESGELFSSSTISTNQFTDNAQDKCKQMPNNPYSWRQPKELHSDYREFSSPMSENCSDNANATCQLMPNNPFWSRQLNQLHAESRKYPTLNSSNVNSNSHSEYKPNTFPPRQRKRVYKEAREFGSTTSSSNLSNSQSKLMPKNLFLMKQPKQLNEVSRKYCLTATQKNKIKARYKPMVNNPFSSRLPKQYDSDVLGQPKKRTKLECPLSSPVYDWDI